METVNGEWYMKGCGREDPGRLRTVDQAAALIREIGFLPLFSNEIPGFSVEERSWSGDWWTDDPDRDPWSWRQQLSRRPEILYGKFFDRKAGFVSADWFPVFANYRRDGWDFDALRDEGLAPHRAAKLMEPFLEDGQPTDAEYLSCVLKDRAGFGKGGEPNFEGAVTALQMQLYLTVGDFRQRRNRGGLPYGWAIAVYAPPENLWGYEAVTAAYGESPERSGERILRRMEELYPIPDRRAAERLIREGRIR
jgi:hypothetical protein